MVKKILFICYLIFLAEGGAQAQSNHLKHIYLDLDAGLSVAENSFTRSWDQPFTFNLESRIDFYNGQLGGGIRYARFNASQQLGEAAGFQSFFAYLGWEYILNISEHWGLQPGLRFGNNFMLFDEAQTFTAPWTYTLDDEESEFSYELFLRTNVNIPRTSWSIYATFSYNRTLTYHPLSTGLISIGVSRSFNTPSWVKEVFE